MTTAAFSEEAKQKFRAAYPTRPTHLTHLLVGHPLLEIDALAELAHRLEPKYCEYNAATDLPLGIAYEDTPRTGLSVHETIASIGQCGSWVLLKHVETDPVYRDLLRDTLAQLREEIEPVTGEMLRLESFIFISSPQAVTPLHFDPEYNILFQIRGSKTMTVFPAGDDEMITQAFFEQYFDGGPRNLPWKANFAPRGHPIDIVPGEAIYVPILAPHWVKTHEEVSVSLSLTWRSKWSFQHADAHRFNTKLRKLGLKPAPPRLYPGDNSAKSLAYRRIGGLKRALLRQQEQIPPY